MTLEYIFSKNYLFDPMPSQESRLYIPLLMVFSLLIIFAILIRLAKKLDAKVKNRQFYCYLICGVSGFVYLFARFEGLPWFGSRFFLALVVLTTLIWATVIVLWMISYLPKVKKEKESRETFEKFLPKKK